MKVIMLYRPNSEHDSLVRSYLTDYNRLSGKHIETISLDSVEGAEKARVYDVVEYPALIATSDSGAILKSWQGKNLPLFSEVGYYDQQ